MMSIGSHYCPSLTPTSRMSPPALAAEIHPGHESCASFPPLFPPLFPCFAGSITTYYGGTVSFSFAIFDVNSPGVTSLQDWLLTWVVEDFEVFRESSVIREGKGASLTEVEPLALTE